MTWLVPIALTVACSDSDDIDFFEPGDDMQTGGAATTGGTDAGGGSNGGSTSTGGSETSGGTTGTTGGSGGDTGGSGNEGGTDSGGMGGSMASGGSEIQGGSSGTAGEGGTTTGGTGGSAGDAMGGAGAGGAGMGGTGMAGAGMGGAGMAGAGMGGAGVGGASGAAGAGGCVPTSPSTERCDGIDNNCTNGVDEGMACPANCTGATRAGHTYMFCSFEGSGGAMNRERTWMQALDYCQMRDLGLVFIESAEENAYILEWITKMQLEDQVWIGANDRDLTLQNNEGEWVWGTANNAVQFWDGNENGDPVMDRYEDWATGEPNNQGNEDCAVMSADHDYHWDDRLCSNSYTNFVCESGSAIMN